MLRAGLDVELDCRELLDTQPLCSDVIESVTEDEIGDPDRSART